MITVIGSHLCPDTLEALAKLQNAGVEYEFKNMMASHDELRAYLNLRDTHELYAEIRGTERLGVPCFVCDCGKVTMDLNEVLAK